jgi:[ribosomal protein S5]-alanine N-acetyltransferase
MSIAGAFARFPSHVTKRLLLRQIRRDDADDLFAIFSDEETTRFYGHEPHRSLDDTHTLIEQAQANYARRESIQWGITLHGEDRVIGSCGFHHFDQTYRVVETGYALHRDRWGQGIMTEAMSAILTYGFKDLDLHRVEAIIDIANERSKGLLLKLGFTYEGNLRQRYFFRDHYEDEYYFGLLKDEWHGTE